MTDLIDTMLRIQKELRHTMLIILNSFIPEVQKKSIIF
jgi:hypothetical protein